MMRRNLISILIVVWLSLQIAIPFARKFGTFPFHYQYATFSWAMFSKPAIRYEVSIFRKNRDGVKEAIPDIGRFVYGYRSPELMKQRNHYRSPAEIKDRFAQLVRHIAERSDSNFQYSVEIRWVDSLDFKEPPIWEYSVNGISS